MGKLSNFSKKTIVASVVFVVFNSIEVFALQPPQQSQSQPQFTPMQRPTEGKNPRYQTKEEKLQQLQQEATTAVTEIDAEYAKIIGYVNSGQKPTKEELNEAQKVVLKNRKYLMVLDNSQKGIYHVLSAWVYYFDEKNDKAAKQAESGQKVSPQNLNTVKTRLALSLICKDYQALMESLTDHTANTTRPIPQPQQISAPGIPGMPGMSGMPSYTQTSQTAEGDLQLDVNAVRIELLGKVFDSNLSPLDSNSPSWQSSGRLISAMLWKIDSSELDRFAPAVPKLEPNEPNAPAPGQEQNIPAPQQQVQGQSAGGPSPYLMPGMGAISPVNPDLESQSQPQPQYQPTQPVPPPMPMPMPMPMPEPTPQMIPQPGLEQPYTDLQTQQRPEFESFAKLQELFAKEKRTAFAAINFNDPAKKANLSNWLTKNPQKWQTVFLSAEQQVLTPLSDNLDEPLLLIIAPDSTIRYAGKVEGFLPRMLIRSILDNPEDVNKADVNLPAIEYKQPAPRAPQPVLPLVGEQNSITQTVSQPNNVNDVKAPAVVNQNQDDDFFDPRAVDLLENAKAFFKIGNRLQYHTYQKPIDMCRTVMKDYPNTKYATEAQVLLRKVPERFRERYNLTDKELGL